MAPEEVRFIFHFGPSLESKRAWTSANPFSLSEAFSCGRKLTLTLIPWPLPTTFVLALWPWPWWHWPWSLWTGPWTAFSHARLKRNTSVIFLILVTLAFDLWPANLFDIWWTLMCVLNIRSVCPAVRLAKWWTDRHAKGRYKSDLWTFGSCLTL